MLATLVGFWVVVCTSLLIGGVEVAAAVATSLWDGTEGSRNGRARRPLLPVEEGGSCEGAEAP